VGHEGERIVRIEDVPGDPRQQLRAHGHDCIDGRSQGGSLRTATPGSRSAHPSYNGVMADPDGPDMPDVPLGDVLRDAPLLREIQRVLLSSPGPVNWELARQIGIGMASGGMDDPAPTDHDRQSFVDSVRLAELEVADFTSMPIPGELATVEALRRAQWVEANVHSLRDLLDPVAARLTAVMGEQGMPGLGTLPG